MRCTIPEISWHNRDPVLSIDIQPVATEGGYRLASAGADCHIMMWHLKVLPSGLVNLSSVSDLTRHQKAVNVVRWSPTGHFLASADDDGYVILWSLKTDDILLLEDEITDKEVWLVHKILRWHKEDVYDICWSPDGLKLLSGSIDNTAILWDINKGKCEHILTDHKGFVQGVAWDPKGQYIATLSSDRICRIFDNTGKTVQSRTHKGILPVPESHSLYNKEIKYFHDDTFKSYFRRLSFSCDGNLLFLPSGCIDLDNSKSLQATYIFSLDQFTQPAAILPSPKQITIATRCCPILFELHNSGPGAVINLPYRMIVAVATDRDVLLYDTQQLLPIAHYHRIHYTRITDLTWSPDGLLLLVSSTDGFCTIIVFDENELGIKYSKEESEEEEEDIVNKSGFQEEENIKTIKKPNILEQWTLKTSKSVDTNGERKATPIAVRRGPKTSTLTKNGIEKTPEGVDHSHSVTYKENDTIKEKEKQTITDVPKDTIVTNESYMLEEVKNRDLDKTQIEVKDHKIIIIEESSPVKPPHSPSTNEHKNLDNKNYIDTLQTPRSISKFNRSTNNVNSSSSSKRRKKQSKHPIIKSSPLLKFFQKSSVNNKKDDKAATRGITKEETRTKGQAVQSNSPSKEQVIVIEDSNDSLMNSENTSQQITDRDIVTASTEKENVNLQGVAASNAMETDKHLSNLTGNESPTSKVLSKPARRIQLVTLSSPKRKKQE